MNEFNYKQRPATPEYRANWDRIFKRPVEVRTPQTPAPAPVSGTVPAIHAVAEAE